MTDRMRLTAFHLAMFSLASGASLVAAQESEEATPDTDAADETSEDIPSSAEPFGANLFTGSYAAQREDVLNPEYRILPGDRVMVNLWGSASVNDVFTVDTQGNIFLPTVGPIHLAGVRNADLTGTVRTAARRVYRGPVGVYTNLLTASPVAVFVTGNVVRPGRYAGIPSDSLLFFLHQAGGIDGDSGSFREIRVVREANVVTRVDLYDFLREGNLPSIQFTDGDAIVVARRGPTATVHRPGQRPVMLELTEAEVRGQDVVDLLPPGPRIVYVTLRGMRNGQVVAQTVGREAFSEISVRDGEEIYYAERHDASSIVVNLVGAAQGPSQLAVPRGTRLQDLLNYVAVDPAIANTHAVFIQRPRIRREQRRALRESLDRLERTTMLALSDTSTESQIRVREAELVRQFIDRARDIEPLGRMVTASAGHQLNVLLENGDTIVVPTRTNVVRVVGEVGTPHAVMYRPDLRIEDYVRMAGGYSARADRGNAIILHPNAEIDVVGGGAEIRPGDEIMVPPAVDDKFLQNGIDLAQVIYQLAVAASVVLRPL